MLRCLLALVFVVSFVSGLNNGVGSTPQMGWNSWNYYACDGYNYTVLRQTVDAFFTQGLYAAGYNYLNIDDCWAEYYRTSNGTLQPDKQKFPQGETMQDLIDYVHQRGMLFGLYSDAGERTCANHDPGSLGHEQIDAQTFADWGVDYLKYDNCNNEGERALERYPPMRDAILSTNRPLFFSLCEWGRERVPTWGRAVGNSWRTTKDISDHWESMLYNLYLNNHWVDYAGPGGWNDPDMLEVGNGGMTTTEYISHFSLWSLMKAPLIIGCDVITMDATTRGILTNTEVIAVNQDSRGIQGKLIRSPTDTTEVWAGPLTNGNVAAILFNRGRSAANITMEWDDLNIIPSVTASVRDLWAHKDLGTFSRSYTGLVESHGVLMFKIIPSYSLDYAQ
uniref:Alpha-galactosidase n=1 Tax=Vannella robusta TaxID=1487602 RepID=A0A7S4IS01_9EUKA|mmetsp:Transcript_7632/g.9462  ORF Transcript_7632/g.9462 Transcript_7632/m.9462 type:complete len:392 (+) Transcript_7632:62-1237(+)